MGLFLRKAARYLQLSYVMAPLFRYMRWSASRNTDDIFLLWVHPNEISRTKLFSPERVPVIGPNALRGSVGGPWDLLTIPVRNHYVFQSIRAHLREGVEWSETQIYDHPKYRDDPERARRRCEKIEAIIASIRVEGYRRQYELGDGENAPREWIKDMHVGDEIIVGMNRNGDLIHLKNGRHRLAVAQILDVDRIPVILSMYHPRAANEIPADAEEL